MSTTVVRPTGAVDVVVVVETVRHFTKTTTSLCSLMLISAAVSWSDNCSDHIQYPALTAAQRTPAMS